MRLFGMAIFVSLAAMGTASAQTADWRFHWQEGKVLNYRVEQITDVAETVGSSKTQMKSKVNLIKRWEVVAVDAQGVATLKMSITSMRNEQTRPSGDVVLFDSQSPDQSAPELREQLGKFVGQTLAILRVDGQGRVIEVKQGMANRYEAEPPFTLTLSSSAKVAAGQSWRRDYAITLDPPQGAGEKHAAVQKYVCTRFDANLATISVVTELVSQPQNKMQQLPLLQKLPQGEIVFDLAHGRLQSVRLTIDRAITDHQGEDSSYRFQSTYGEEYID